jgi:hypothetical protein
MIIGGYGVFGGKLAQRLLADRTFDIVIAGRSLEKATKFCQRYGGYPARINIKDTDITAQVGPFCPKILVDASGPYQADRSHRTAEAALNIGAHYLDLSDDAAFSESIKNLDAKARAAGLTLLSGASSVPAISSSVCDALAENFNDVHLIESAILPGNKAPRGKSVMRSILLQAGRPLRVWRSKQWTQPTGWSEQKRLTLSIPETQSILKRPANLIGAPDLTLFPERYNARTVLFRAGLELPLMHHGLHALAWLAKSPLKLKPEKLTGLLKWVADRLKPLGSDRGGMLVRMVGTDTSGEFSEAIWTLIVEKGDGPQIPATPAYTLIEKLMRGEVQPGARPCLGEFCLDELEASLEPLNVHTHTQIHPARRLFSTILGADFQTLPKPIQHLHTFSGQQIWRGEARVRRGRSIRSKLAGLIAGFPPAQTNVPVELTMHETTKGEIWRRTFGVSRFSSKLHSTGRKNRQVITETFGLMHFDIALNAKEGKLYYPITKGNILGVPLPKWLLPVSETLEYVDEKGRACFDVSISLPFAGPVVHYQGWLKPA